MINNQKSNRLETRTMTDKETEVFNRLIEIIKFYQVDVREIKKQDYKKYITKCAKSPLLQGWDG